MRFKHLDDNKETYCEHFKVAGCLSCRFFVGGFKTFIHALWPDFWTTAATDTHDDVSRIIRRGDSEPLIET